jgi:diguanylate cyclase (GGDEF)-like protein
VAMLDLDNFKTANDTLGHKAGDAILVEAAARLTGCTRATDTVARYGGDEFLVLLDDLVSIDVAEIVARKMRRALARPFTVEERQVQIGVSIGVALFPKDGSDPDELLRFADTAMYKAKRSGRDQIRFHGKT